MRYLVFGETGQVARELQRLPGVETLSRAEADLSRTGVCAEAIRRAKPDVVINAAAYTAVDRAEGEEPLALQVNGHAPGEMAMACAALDLPFLQVSTDYVFSGNSETAWRETDPVAPINAYGRSKLAGERAVQAAGGHWAILRTSWVFSAHGSNFVKTMLRLSEARSHLDIVDDQVGGPTPAADIACALHAMGRLMAEGNPGGIYHFAGAPAVSWADFARSIFERAGRDMTVNPVPSSAWPTAAARPLNSRLDCRKLTEDFGIPAPDWRRGLSKVVRTLEARV